MVGGIAPAAAAVGVDRGDRERIGALSLGLGLVLEETRSGLLAAGLPQSWVTPLVANSGWRLLMFLGAVPAFDGGRVGGVGVEMVLEEIAAAGGAQPVAAVQQALIDRLTGEGGAGGVQAEQGAQRGRVGYKGWYT